MKTPNKISFKKNRVIIVAVSTLVFVLSLGLGLGLRNKKVSTKPMPLYFAIINDGYTIPSTSKVNLSYVSNKSSNEEFNFAPGEVKDTKMINDFINAQNIKIAEKKVILSIKNNKGDVDKLTKSQLIGIEGIKFAFFPQGQSKLILFDIASAKIDSWGTSTKKIEFPWAS